MRTAPEELTFVIGICTFRRAEQLEALLSDLQQQLQQQSVQIDAEVWIVDNDPDGSASEVARRFEVRYFHEPRKGVGYARSRLLAELPDVDMLIFFDDDQKPQAQWLSEFIAAHKVDPEAMWSGPVQPEVLQEVESWARNYWPWRREVYRNGHLLPHAGNGNLLIPAAILRSPDCAYDRSFMTGMGEDTELTSRLVSKGYRLRYSAGAAATEFIPAERRSIEWIINRRETSALVQARIWAAHGKPWRTPFSAGRHIVRASLFWSLGRVLNRPDYLIRARCDRRVTMALARTLVRK